eukprot:Polyplicarium_translucidae@DN1893_c0_g1_i1.p2
MEEVRLFFQAGGAFAEHCNRQASSRRGVNWRVQRSRPWILLPLQYAVQRQSIASSSRRRCRKPAVQPPLLHMRGFHSPAWAHRPSLRRGKLTLHPGGSCRSVENAGAPGVVVHMFFCGVSRTCERTRTSWKSWAAPRNMQFRVRQIRSVAFWYWKGCGDSCGICTEAFDHACPSCNQPGDQCPPALGACGHSFHLHCINQWLQQGSNPLCPMCRREFCFKSARPVETPCTLR